MEASKSCWLFCMTCIDICANQWSKSHEDVLRIFSKYRVSEYLKKDDMYEALDYCADEEIADFIKSYIVSKGGIISV